MQRGTMIWIGLLGLGIGAAVYEAPNVVLNLRYYRNTFTRVEDNVERAVPDRLITDDREAGEILRYAIRRYADYAGRGDLKTLTAKYPQNEFFLSELAAALAESKNTEPEEVQGIADRLLPLDPNNAYYRYFKGWLLLETEGGKQRVAEALEQFELGNRLPRFAMPYSKYKARVDRIAERAALDRWDRPQTRKFYSSQTSIITEPLGWEHVDAAQADQLIAAGSTMADRIIRNAYDVDSLTVGGRMMESIEETRLRTPGLSESQRREAKKRQDVARTIETLNVRWGRDLWLTFPSMQNMMPWLILIMLLAAFIRRRSLLLEAQDATKTTASAGMATGGIMLIALALFMVFHGWHSSLHMNFLWKEGPWIIFWFSWIGYSEFLAHAVAARNNPSRSIWRRLEIAFALLWLNGTILLLINHSEFLWSGRFAGWPRSLPFMAVWLVFCGLLWVSTRDPKPVFGRISYSTAVIIVVSGTAFLLSLDAFGTRWHYESRAYAEPLSLCHSLLTDIQGAIPVGIASEVAVR